MSIYHCEDCREIFEVPATKNIAMRPDELHIVEMCPYCYSCNILTEDEFEEKEAEEYDDD